MKDIIFIFSLAVYLISCEKDKVEVDWKQSRMYINDEKIDIHGKEFYMKKKDNGEYRYQICVTDGYGIGNYFGEPITSGTVLSLSFLGDTITELDANQQLVFDDECYIAWGVMPDSTTHDPDSSSFERKEYIKEGYFSITGRERHTLLPSQVSFTGTTVAGTRIDLITDVYKRINQAFYQKDLGRITYEDTVLILSHGWHIYNNNNGEHMVEISHYEFIKRSYNRLQIYFYNNGTDVIPGVYYGISEDTSYFFDASLNVWDENNIHIISRDFAEGSIKITMSGLIYSIDFCLIDQGDTARGIWMGPFE